MRWTRYDLYASRHELKLLAPIHVLDSWLEQTLRLSSWEGPERKQIGKTMDCKLWSRIESRLATNQEPEIHRSFSGYNARVRDLKSMDLMDVH
jgi:hypothetical protein